MWKSIKKFFKWIADHTGISWIFGKFSSSQHSDNKVSQVDNAELRNARYKEDERIKNLVPLGSDVVGAIEERDSGLVLHLETKNAPKVVCKDVKNIEENLSEYPIYIECKEGNVFKITLKQPESRSLYTTFSIVKVNENVPSNQTEVKNMLGLEGRNPVIITKISKNPITPNPNGCLKLANDKIEFITSDTNYESLQARFKNKRGDGTVVNGEFRADFKLNDKQLYITGRYNSKTTMKSGDICLSINSVGTQDGKEVYGDNELERMKELLGNIAEEIKIYAQPPIVPKPASKVLANSNTPNSEITEPGVEKTAVNGQSAGSKPL